MGLTATDLGSLDALDFEPALPCEHSQHAERHRDEPAMFEVQSHCKCGDGATFLLCLSGWERSKKATCQVCYRSEPRDRWLTIVRVIGGPR